LAQIISSALLPYPDINNGCFSVPEAPGWGVELDIDFLEKHPPEKTKDGEILDPGLNMFSDENWQKRAGQSKQDITIG
jgi:galactonate dehydratase